MFFLRCMTTCAVNTVLSISHQDFYTRAHHLFEVLVDILEGQSPRDEVKPKGSQKYSQHYDNLLGTKRLTALDVENYILAVAKAAHSNENDDRTRAFYQRLLGRIMLPKLLLGARLSDEIFQKIVQEIPQEMLFEEQMLLEQRYKNSMLNSSLFLLLSASPCPTIIDRYCFIVSKYQSASDEVAIKFYQSSASFLRNIQNLAELPKTIINQAAAVVILQALLLSVRDSDRRKATAVLRDYTHIDQVELVRAVFCKQSFLDILKLKQRDSQLLVDVFLSFAEIIKTVHKVKDRTYLLHAFSSSCTVEDEYGESEPFFQVDKWPSDVRVSFLRLLDRDTRKIYECEDIGSAFRQFSCSRLNWYDEMSTSQSATNVRVPIAISRGPGR